MHHISDTEHYTYTMDISMKVRNKIRLGKTELYKMSAVVYLTIFWLKIKAN